MTLDELKEHGLYPESFDERLAPRRYHELKASKELPKVFVVYGLRRTGKTFALIKLGEHLMKQGYEFYYHAAEIEEDEFIKNSGALGKTLADLVKAGKKLFVVLDEAFNLPVPIIGNFLGPFASLEGGDFSIALSGSYTYDLFLLRAEAILRHFSQLASKRIFYTTTPRIGLERISGRDLFRDFVLPTSRIIEKMKEIKEISLLEYLTSLGLVHRGKLRSKVLDTYRRIISTGGLPRVLRGISSLEDEISALAELIESAYVSDLKIKIHKKKQRPKREKVLETIKKMISRGSGSYYTIRLSNESVRLALATSLILPRRYIDASSSRGLKEELKSFEELSRRLFSYPARPIPSSYAAKLLLEELGVKNFYSGITYESIIAHALLEHYFRYTDKDTLIRKIPIFTLNDIDFLITLDSFPIGIEVKSSLNSDVLAKIIERASLLGINLIVAVPAEYLEGYVPEYRISLGKLYGDTLEEGLSLAELEKRALQALLSISFLLHNIRGKFFVECDLKGDKAVCSYTIAHGKGSIELEYVVSNAPIDVIEILVAAVEKARDALGSSYMIQMPIIAPIELLVVLLSGTI